MAGKRRGLGRGIGALIPENQTEDKDRPIDVFFGKSPMLTGDSFAATEAEGSSVSTTISSTSTGEVSRDTSKNKESVSEKNEGRASRKPRMGVDKSIKANNGTEKIKSSENGDSSEINSEVSQSATSVSDGNGEELLAVPGATYAELPLTAIVPNQKQPRSVFDEDDLNELANSIKEVGVLQPVIVRPLTAPLEGNAEARYELIMGERRWRASSLAGNESIPAIVRRTLDEDLLRDALLENLHRAQLNALEEAAAYQQLLEDFNCTQEELSKRIARSRPQISNTLRLLKLPPLVQRRVAAGVLSAGHARALLGLSDPGAMEHLAQRIVAEGLSVRQVEEIVALGEETKLPAGNKRRAKRFVPELADLSGRLADRLDTRVKVEMGAKKGAIRIDFASIEDLNRILAVLTPDEDGIALPEVSDSSL